jgi:hypothetical protein
MLFLGAGASKAFKLPDLSEITTRVMENIRDCKSYGKISELKNILDNEYRKINNNNNEVDIEILLTVLNTINSEDDTNITDPLKLLIQNINKDNLGKIEYTELIEFKDKVAKTFIDNLKITADNKELIKKITDYYTKLLTSENFQYNIFQKIVTTNYDNIIEVFSQGTSNQYFKKFLKYRGFSEDTLPEFILHKNPNYVPSFLKLHGSLDWWIDETKTEITLSESNESYGKHLGERLMIYPIHEKYISEFPFYYTYNAFRKMLQDERIIVVIGYSFRDESINNAFRSKYLMEKENKKENFSMLICTTSKEVKERVTKIFEDKMISVIDSNFFEDNFIEKLTKRINDII